jgi:hypothetical protein
VLEDSEEEADEEEAQDLEDYEEEVVTPTKKKVHRRLRGTRRSKRLLDQELNAPPETLVEKPKKRKRPKPKLQFIMWTGNGHMGKTGKSSKKPVELNPPWVLHIFNDKKERDHWQANPGIWCELSAGAPDPSRNNTLPARYYKDLQVEYPQENKTCLASSFASVLHMAGHVKAGIRLQKNIQEGKLDRGAANLL